MYVCIALQEGIDEDSLSFHLACTIPIRRALPSCFGAPPGPLSDVSILTEIGMIVFWFQVVCFRCFVTVVWRSRREGFVFGGGRGGIRRRSRREGSIDSINGNLDLELRSGTHVGGSLDY